MKNLIVLAFMLLAGSASANPAFEVGYSSFGVRGVIVTTGTVMQFNLTPPAGFTARVAGYRIRNQDSADAIWVGGPSLSTATTNNNATLVQNLGEKLEPGENAVWMAYKDFSRSGVPFVPIYAMAADAAGATGVALSVIWFGY